MPIRVSHQPPAEVIAQAANAAGYGKFAESQRRFDEQQSLNKDRLAEQQRATNINQRFRYQSLNANMRDRQAARQFAAEQRLQQQGAHLERMRVSADLEARQQDAYIERERLRNESLMQRKQADQAFQLEMEKFQVEQGWLEPSLEYLDGQVDELVDSVDPGSLSPDGEQSYRRMMSELGQIQKYRGSATGRKGQEQYGQMVGSLLEKYQGEVHRWQRETPTIEEIVNQKRYIDPETGVEYNLESDDNLRRHAPKEQEEDQEAKRIEMRGKLEANALKEYQILHNIYLNELKRYDDSYVEPITEKEAATSGRTATNGGYRLEKPTMEQPSLSAIRERMMADAGPMEGEPAPPEPGEPQGFEVKLTGSGTADDPIKIVSGFPEDASIEQQMRFLQENFAGKFVWNPDDQKTYPIPE